MIGTDYTSNQRDQLKRMVLPVNTTDNYRQYFVGFANGMQAEQNGPWYNVFTALCNNTDEYCNGFRAGWTAQSILDSY